MDKEGKKRLLKLAALLHDNSKGRVVHIPGDGKPRFDMDAWLRESADCGTAACGVGCAMLSPWFQKQGLETRKTRDWRGRMIQAPAFGRKLGWKAVQAFFGISEDEAVHLFDPFRYDRNPTPKQVARRIRAFVRGNA